MVKAFFLTHFSGKKFEFYVAINEKGGITCFTREYCNEQSYIRVFLKACVLYITLIVISELVIQF